MIANTITKEEFLKLNEDNLMFITNPGRMWDEDGISFVMKENNTFILYRVDGWMYDERTEDSILLKDAIKVFPKWNKIWENCNNENYQGKYQYIYMGFGNGLSVDKRIYEKYKPYLEKYLTSERKPIEIFTNWKKALADMINDDDKIDKNIRDVIMGTAIGDIVGSIYEFSGFKSKEFEFFDPRDKFTDDTVMTFAVVKALLEFKSIDTFEELVINNMVNVGLKYPNCGYGSGFKKWLTFDHKPYGSYANGAAMRVSAIPVAFKDEETIKKICKIVTNVSHNHEESLMGAEIVCMAIHLALQNKTKEYIKYHIENNYIKLDKTLDDIKKSDIKGSMKCIDTVIMAMSCFLESKDYEDSIRNAISIGGDSDTIAAVVGGIAAAYYGIPKNIYNKGMTYLDEYLKDIHSKFIEKYI